MTREYWSSLAGVDIHHGLPSDRVWGVAYRIPVAKIAEVRDYLDLREINGYTIDHTPFYPADITLSPESAFSTIHCIVYIGTPDNPQFVGPQDPQALAKLIARNVGPSGPNKEYLFMLERALDELCPDSGDAHVKDLADRVRALEERC